MKFLFVLCVLHVSYAEWYDTLHEGFKEADEEIHKVGLSMHELGRQVMLQKFYTEQRMRADGDSGLKLVRIRRQGNKNYHSEAHNGYSIASIHSHANNIRTVGMGELEAVLNGVQFRTRHNDYRLYQPSTTSSKFGETEPIPFPDVPPSVKNKGSNIDAQVTEMREYFRAWRDQDKSIRDYEPYFKSILCYLEGAWTKSKDNIDEPFDSDRHFIDAKTWQDLQQKSMFTDYTGSKSRLENLALLPTAIMGFYNHTTPIYAQFNYRILCHPLEKLVKTNRLRPVDDLAARVMANRDPFKYAESRQARFQVNLEDADTFDDEKIFDGKTYLDELMEQVPGKSNYAGNMKDEGFEEEPRDTDGSPLNAAYYHRVYKTTGKDEKGRNIFRRGFSDKHLYMALTNHTEVAGMTFKKCSNYEDESTCKNITQRWTYAIPLELIYLTPLSTWNPYDIEYYGDSNTDEGKQVTANGRSGVCGTNAQAYKGSNSRTYYRTPSIFFSGQSSSEADTADTMKSEVCALDKWGNKRAVKGSGTWIFLPDIKGIGNLRQRYPIMPINGHGSGVWKELSAFKDTIMSSDSSINWGSGIDSADIELKMADSEKAGITKHQHEILMTTDEIDQLKSGIYLRKTTNFREGHTHALTIRYKDGVYQYTACEGQNRCWDMHGTTLTYSD